MVRDTHAASFSSGLCLSANAKDHAVIVLPSHDAWQQALSPLLSARIPPPQAAEDPKQSSLLDDRAGAAAALRKSLTKRGIDLICPHRQTRKKAP